MREIMLSKLTQLGKLHLVFGAVFLSLGSYFLINEIKDWFVLKQSLAVVYLLLGFSFIASLGYLKKEKKMNVEGTNCFCACANF